MKQNNEELTDEEYDEEVKFYLYESHPDFCKPMQKYVDTFQAEEPFICPECRRASTKSKTSQVCVRCESEYHAGLNPPMRVPWPGDDGYYAETFEAELPILAEPVIVESLFGIPLHNQQGENNPGGTVLGKFVARKDHPSGYYKKGDKALITIYEESADRNYDMYNNYIGPLFYKIKLIFDEAYFTYPANTRNLPLMATPQDIEQNWRMIDAETFGAEDDADINKFARTNAGGALWQATYQALRDEGRSHQQAETFCNTKFFDHYYEYLIEGLRAPMRNLINRLQKPRLGLTRNQRKYNRDARQRVERYFPDMASEEFEAHEGGHIDEATYQDSFEAPNRYPVRPTRPSEDWPRPTPRPRRPNRRPNPRPRPARRPF